MENAQNFSHLPYVHTHTQMFVSKSNHRLHIFFVLFVEIFLFSVVVPGECMLSHFSPV